MPEASDEIGALRIALAKATELLALKDDEIRTLRERLAVFEDQLRRLVRGRFGASTEKMIHDPGQQVLDLGPASPPPSAPSAADEALPAAPRQRRRPRRRRLAEAHPELPVEERIIDLPSDQRRDVDGSPLVPMGREVTELLATDAPRVYIKRLVRIRYGRSDTGEKVAIAALPVRINPRGMLDDSIVHRLVVAKFEDCLPLHRQERIFARHGVHLPRSVQMDNVKAWAACFTPLAEAIRRQVLREPVVHADESAMRMLDRTLRRRCRMTNVWALTAGGQVAYHWTPDRTTARARELIGGYRGFLVRDEWHGWRGAIDGERVVPVGCNAHARRPFAELQAIDADAAAMVALYGRLYEVERAAAASGMAGPELWAYRLTLRHAHSRTIMAEIKDLAERLGRTATPAGTLGRGAAYIRRHWDTLTRFLDDGRLPPDNNQAENVLRQVAVLRKNALFLGSPDGGAWTAVALTVLRSCRLQSLNHDHYLAAVTPAVLAVRDRADAIARLDEWTPAAYARRANAPTAAAG